MVCFGEMLIDFVPTINGVSLAESPAFKKAAGGAPANVAVGISRLGGSSAFIGKVSILSHYSLISVFTYLCNSIYCLYLHRLERMNLDTCLQIF